jgi:diguanylate cyclase (GGDEF)-like protein
LTERLRETDVVGRWGGDEFTVLLPRASYADAVRVATELLEMVRKEAAIVSGARRMELTASIGVTTFVGGAELEPEEILKSADAAMYRAKGSGRNRVEFSELASKQAVR